MSYVARHASVQNLIAHMMLPVERANEQLLSGGFALSQKQAALVRQKQAEVSRSSGGDKSNEPFRIGGLADLAAPASLVARPVRGCQYCLDNTHAKPE